MRIPFLCSVYLAAIAGAELVAALVSPLWGLIFYFFILFLLIISSAALGKRFYQRLFLAVDGQIMIYPSQTSADNRLPQRLFLVLGLAPLIRIVSLSMPLAEFSEIYSYLFIAVPLLAGTLIIIRALGFHPGDVGLRLRAMPLQVIVALMGAGFGLVGYFILKPEPLTTALTWQESIVPALILLVTTGFVEELIFRGVMQRASVEVLGRWGWLYIAVLFAVIQIGYLSAWHFCFVLLVALFFGWAVKRTGSILGVSLSHGLINICLYLVFPFIF